MSNPVWEWLFRGRIDPYIANLRFRGLFARLLKKHDYPEVPRWAGCRMGQSRTELADGRILWVAGEHEDSYDPDFYIYNDVIVEHPDDQVQILGYPRSHFRPTDFHTATLIEDGGAILILGNLGYPEDRREGFTPLYRLDTCSYQIKEIMTSGDGPGWIHHHEARLDPQGQQILIQGGKVLSEDDLIENIDQWALRLSDFHWERLTARTWPRFRVLRSDEKRLHLFDYGMLDFYREFPQEGSDPFAELAAELGADPDLDTFANLYRPSHPHEPIAATSDPDGEEEDENGWRTVRISIDGVCVRFVDDGDHVAVTVEGELPKSTLDELAAEFCKKLSLLENAPCAVKWIS